MHIPQPRPTTLSTTNSRTNTSWGDSLSDLKSPDITRVYITNLNGLQLDARGGKFDSVCRSMKEIQVDVLCAQEHNVDTTQASLRNIIFDTARQHWDRHRLVISTSPIPFKTQFKPGGTMVLTTGSLTGRMCKQTRDKWGRWSCQEFQGQGGRKLVIISAYQPIVKGGTQGTITVASQHVSLLLRSHDTVTNPRVAFRRDLIQCLQNYKASAYDILLTGDFNEPFGSDPDGMGKIADQFQLLDLMSARHSSSPPATYARGSTRLDYVLASSSVCSAVQQAGYEAFNKRIASDHRGYFIDFRTQDLFGSDTQQLASRVLRNLSASNHTQVTAYIRKKYDLLAACNAFDRSERLRLPGNRHVFAERLDNDLMIASLTAEKDLPQFGEPSWSVELAQARKLVSLLTKQLSVLTIGLSSQDPSLQTQAQELHTSLPSTKTECSQRLRQAKRDVHNLVQLSVERRDDEMKRKLQSLESSTLRADHVTAQHLRRIKKAEDIKNLFKKLKYVRNSAQRKGVTRVEIPRDPQADPKKCNDWVQVDIPTDILDLLQKRNRAHFGQAFGSPFTIPPLSTQLGFDGSGTYGQQILEGTYDADGLSENVQLLIQYMKSTHERHQAPASSRITADELRSKLKVWSESTTTSPSGIHLGHYKALIARHSYNSDANDDELTPEFIAQRDELNFKQQELFNLHLEMINYTIEKGYSYKRWQTIANTILFKDPDNVRLHRTRVIHIYEADFNLMLGVKWRSAMHHAEDHRLLNDGQYGSRANRCATDPVLIEELQCEISRATRKPVILTNYDATACYDRIIPNLGMLVSQKFGVEPTVTRANALTLEKAEYRVRTELGLAPTGYSHSESFPIYGTGQGSANSPAIWCFLSSTLFDCYDQVVHPAHYATPAETHPVNLGMIGFVDDCNGQTNSFTDDGSSTTLQKLIQQTRHNAQAWNDLLSASGGALELSKCSCHVLQWQFTIQGAPILVPTHASSQSSLQVKDQSTGEQHNLHLLSAYEAHKTLGHYKAPAGTSNEQYRQLKKKSDELTNFLWTCPLTRNEAWTFYYACYLPSIGYPLPCSALSRKQLDSIQRKAMAIIFARCGYNRNTKREILYGPLELGGANFRHLHVQQGVGQVTTFIRHWRLNSTAGQLLKIAVSWFQLQAGTSTPILEDVGTILPHLESNWIGSLRTFMAEHRMQLQLDESFIPAPQRLYDVHLMDVIIQSMKFTAAEIRRLNYCRLYLKAVTLSDLSSLSGEFMDPDKLKGQFSLNSSRTHGPCIHQERPSDNEWRLWRKMCKLLFCNPSGKLFEALTYWTVPVTQQRQQHPAYFETQYLCDGDAILWIRVQNEYIRCTQTRNPRLYKETSQARQWKDIPDAAHPAEAILVSPDLWQITYDSSTYLPVQPRPAATFDQYVSRLPTWEVDLLTHFEFPQDPFTASLHLAQGVRAVSDGSVWDDNQGAYGWTISTDRGERTAYGMGPARGAQVDSYRAEAYGMLATLCFLRRLAEYTTQMDPWVGILATDSQSLLEAITQKPDRQNMFPLYSRLKPRHHLDVKCPEWDLLSIIIEELEKWPDLRLQHVRGHQDRTTAYDCLSLLAQLNVDADTMATRYQCEYGSPRPIVFLTRTAGVHLVTPKGTITAHYDTAIRHQATYPALYKYLQERHGWTTRVMSTINWKAHGDSLRKHINRKTHYTKLVHGILPTCKNVHRKDPIRSKCPLCREVTEDWIHILRLPSSR